MAPGAKTGAIPTGVDTVVLRARRPPGDSRASRVQRLDGLASRTKTPSSISASRFCRRSARHVPDASFAIVGRNPTQTLRERRRAAGNDRHRHRRRRAAVSRRGVGLRRAASSRQRNAHEDFRGAGDGKAGRVHDGRRRRARPDSRQRIHRRRRSSGFCCTLWSISCTTNRDDRRSGGPDARSWSSAIRGIRSRANSKRMRGGGARLMMKTNLPTVVLICHEERSPRHRRARFVARLHDEPGRPHRYF